MSRSYRTQKEGVIAKRRVPQNAGVRVIEREPGPGDIHPLPKRTIRGWLQQIPFKYVYGLSRVELRPRRTKGVGKPFGCYWPDEKAIILYSVPPLVWRFPSIRADFRRSLLACHVTITQEMDGVQVVWSDSILISLWYYAHVFTHELGHHYVEQYRTKNGRVGGRVFSEFVAEMHARRFTADFFKRRRAATRKA
jgi:hypothetical protein